jgi:hypothetical protein
MTNQDNINTGQETINDRQGSINKRQTVINDDTMVGLKFNNIIPLIITIISVAGLYFGLSNKIDLLTQKIDYYIQRSEVNVTSIKDLQVKYNELSVGQARCCPN